VFTALSFDRNGEGAIVTDPLGLRFVYYGENDDLVVVSSQAPLVARALSGAGEEPTRDVVGTCSLAYSRYRIGDSTGYQGVHLLPPGVSMVVGSDGQPVLERCPAPWMPPEAMLELPRDQLVDWARAEIAESLRSFLNLPGTRHVVDLSGGKDSRLILAMLLSEGLADSLRFRTTGPPDLVDVRVAAELAEMLGLEHSVEFPVAPPEKPYGDRLREFVRATGGMTNIWYMQPLGRVDPTVHLNGTNGECLRAHQPVRGLPLRRKDDLFRFFDEEMPYGQLQLVRPEIAGSYQEQALTALVEDPHEDSHPVDLLDGFHFRTSARQHFGPKESLNAAMRVLPLYALEALRAAFALGPAARHSELIHLEIIRRCSPELANHRFAGPGWPEELGVAAPASAADNRHHELRSARKTPAPKAEPVMARIRRTAFDRYKDALVEVLREEANPAWEIIDRSKALAATGRFQSLSNPARIELYGAVTAALWLGDGGVV
jgi:hypothetical protein